MGGIEEIDTQGTLHNNRVTIVVVAALIVIIVIIIVIVIIVIIIEIIFFILMIVITFSRNFSFPSSHAQKSDTYSTPYSL